MWESIELRELRVFVTLAEELHFGRTARRLGLTQSRVSQTLRTLERKLGAQLLHRTSRSVRLTPFGERVLADVAPSYALLIGALERSYAVNRRLEGILRLGLLFPTAGGPHLSRIVETFEERHPRCEVRVSDILFDDPLGPLRRGEIDLMATRLPLKQPDLVVGPTLSQEPRVLQVARDHPLAARSRVSIEDVADYHVAALSEFPPETVDAIMPSATPSGRPIRRRRLRPTPRTPFEFEALIARGAIVHPTVPSYADYLSNPDIVSVPIADMPPARSGLVWRRRAADPGVSEFVRISREVLSQLDRAPPRRRRADAPAADETRAALKRD